MPAASTDLAGADVARAYSRWAAVYDWLCGPLFRPAHLAAAQAANRIGGRILEVGVGTGLILPLYRRDSRIACIDLSAEMLAKARRRCVEEALTHVCQLEQMDVHALTFEPESFDVVVMPFVLTLVERPEAAIDEALRVLRPGGEIVIVSHFRSGSAWIAALESWLAPLVAQIGLRPDFPVERLRRHCERQPMVGGFEVARVKPFGVYSMVRIIKA